MEKIMQKIEYFCESKNISNEYISNQLGISIYEYNKIKSGMIDIKLSKLNQIATILNIQIHELFQ